MLKISLQVIILSCLIFGIPGYQVLFQVPPDTASVNRQNEELLINSIKNPYQTILLAASDAKKSFEITAAVETDKITVREMVTVTEDQFRKGFKACPLPASDLRVLEAIEGSFTCKKVRLRILRSFLPYFFTDESVEPTGRPLNLNINHPEGGIYLLEITGISFCRRMKIVKIQ
jgi:hypothetical protein